MARKPKTSPAKDFIFAVSLMPWWIGVLLALLVFAGLHFLATRDLPQPITLENLGSYAGQGLWRMYASLGQWIVPIGLLIGAGISAYKQFRNSPSHLLGGSTNPREGRSSTVILNSPATCPNCGGMIVRRQAKKGPSAGTQFLGCALYPRCRGTRALG